MKVYFAKGTACVDAPSGAVARLGDGDGECNIFLDVDGTPIACVEARSDGPNTWVAWGDIALLRRLWAEKGTLWLGMGRYRHLRRARSQPLGLSTADRMFGVRG